MKIVLDPGHGPTDNLYPDGEHYEGYQMYYLAYYLYQELKQLGRYNLKCTRTKVTDNPTPAERGAMAAGADLFLSIHSNAAANIMVDRVVVIPTITNTEEDFRSFCQELGDTVKLCLACKGDTQIFDRSYQDVNTGKIKDYYAVNRGAVEAGCKKTLILEHSFHTNPEKAKLLSDFAVLKLIAKKEAAVIDAYLTPKQEPEEPADYWGHKGTDPVSWKDLWEILHDPNA